jgi:hypothetical protein
MLKKFSYFEYYFCIILFYLKASQSFWVDINKQYLKCGAELSSYSIFQIHVVLKNLDISCESKIFPFY